MQKLQKQKQNRDNKTNTDSSVPVARLLTISTRICSPWVNLHGTNSLYILALNQLLMALLTKLFVIVAFLVSLYYLIKKKTCWNTVEVFLLKGTTIPNNKWHSFSKNTTEIILFTIVSLLINSHNIKYWNHEWCCYNVLLQNLVFTGSVDKRIRFEISPFRNDDFVVMERVRFVFGTK